MNKKYLYPAAGAYFSALVIAILLAFIMLYAIVCEKDLFFKVEFVEVPFICNMINLVHITLVESNMIVLSRKLLFFYGMDDAEYVPFTMEELKNLLKKHQSLFNETDRLEITPTSHFVRKIFYFACLLFFILGLATTGYNLHELLLFHRWKFGLVCLLLAIDIGLLINRLFFRSSIRYVWGWFHKSIADVLLVENDGSFVVQKEKGW